MWCHYFWVRIRKNSFFNKGCVVSRSGGAEGVRGATEGGGNEGNGGILGNGGVVGNGGALGNGRELGISGGSLGEKMVLFLSSLMFPLGLKRSNLVWIVL